MTRDKREREGVSGDERVLPIVSEWGAECGRGERQDMRNGSFLVPVCVCDCAVVVVVVVASTDDCCSCPCSESV